MPLDINSVLTHIQINDQNHVELRPESSLPQELQGARPAKVSTLKRIATSLAGFFSIGIYPLSNLIAHKVTKNRLARQVRNIASELSEAKSISTMATKFKAKLANASPDMAVRVLSKITPDKAIPLALHLLSLKENTDPAEAKKLLANLDRRLAAAILDKMETFQNAAKILEQFQPKEAAAILSNMKDATGTLLHITPDKQGAILDALPARQETHMLLNLLTADGNRAKYFLNQLSKEDIFVKNAAILLQTSNNILINDDILSTLYTINKNLTFKILENLGTNTIGRSIAESALTSIAKEIQNQNKNNKKIDVISSNISSILEEMSSFQNTKIVANIWSSINHLNPDRATNILNTLASSKKKEAVTVASTIIGSMPADDANKLLTDMHNPAKVGAILSAMDAQKAFNILLWYGKENIPTQVASILTHIDNINTASDILLNFKNDIQHILKNMISTDDGTKKAAAILSNINIRYKNDKENPAGDILNSINTYSAAKIISNIPEERAGKGIILQYIKTKYPQKGPAIATCLDIINGEDIKEKHIARKIMSLKLEDRVDILDNISPKIAGNILDRFSSAENIAEVLNNMKSANEVFQNIILLLQPDVLNAMNIQEKISILSAIAQKDQDRAIELGVSVLATMYKNNNHTSKADIEFLINLHNDKLASQMLKKFFDDYPNFAPQVLSDIAKDTTIDKERQKVLLTLYKENN